jgi:hypothetical protein
MANLAAVCLYAGNTQRVQQDIAVAPDDVWRDRHLFGRPAKVGGRSRVALTPGLCPCDPSSFSAAIVIIIIVVIIVVVIIIARFQNLHRGQMAGARRARPTHATTTTTRR